MPGLEDLDFEVGEVQPFENFFTLSFDVHVRLLRCSSTDQTLFRIGVAEALDALRTTA